MVVGSLCSIDIYFLKIITILIWIFQSGIFMLENTERRKIWKSINL